MPERMAQAAWHGTLRKGQGEMTVDAQHASFPYSFTSRFEAGEGSNPETLIAAAHAGCFSMAFAGELEKAGSPPRAIRTIARITVEPQAGGGFAITRVALQTVADVSNISEQAFQQAALTAKANCPVSKALAAVPEITLDARREAQAQAA